MFGAHSRVDLVFQDESGFHRVQCKTSRLVEGSAVLFRTSSNTNHKPKDYRGEVDLFGVYSPQLEQVFLVPVNDVPPRYGTLRIDPPLNCQEKGVRWARDYVLGSFAGCFHVTSPHHAGAAVTPLFDVDEDSRA
jgi:hypothetical protein